MKNEKVFTNISTKNVFKWLGLLTMSNNLLSLDTFLEKSLGLALPKQACFLLDGCTPDTTNSVGKAWQVIHDNPDFQRVKDSVVDDLTLVNAIIHLTDIFINSFVTDRMLITKELSANELQTAQKDAVEDLEVVKDQIMSELSDNEPDSEDQLQEEGLTPVMECYVLEQGETGNITIVAFVDLQIAVLENTNTTMSLTLAMFAKAGGAEYLTPTEKLRQWEDLRQHVGLRQFVDLLGNISQIEKAAYRESKAQVGVTTSRSLGEFGRTTSTADRLQVGAGNPNALIKIPTKTFNNHVKEEVLPSGLGDLIFIRDESGSMQQGYTHPRLDSGKTPPKYKMEQINKARGSALQDCDKDTQATNLETSMAAIATSRGRKVTAFAFGDGRVRSFRYGIESYDAWKKHMKICFGGGTVITSVLKQALQCVTNKHTDIVIATDGEILDDPRKDQTTSLLLDKYTASGGVIWVIYIGLNPTPVPWATYSIGVDDLMSANANSDLFKMFQHVSKDRSEGRRSL